MLNLFISILIHNFIVIWFKFFLFYKDDLIAVKEGSSIELMLIYYDRLLLLIDFDFVFKILYLEWLFILD